MSKKSRSKLWFLVHSWLALPIWFFVLIVCFTGTLAVVSQEIVWLAQPEVRANKPDGDPRLLNYDEVLQSFQSQRPDVIVESLRRPDEDHFALVVNGTLPDASSKGFYVNPYTGKVQGVEADFNFRQFTRALHGWWLVPFTSGFSWGWYLVSLLGLPLLASLVTGLVVYKKFWKGFFKPLRTKYGARIFWGDLHRLSGVWSIWFIAVISVTGVWFLIQALLSDNQISISTLGPPPIIAREDVPTAAPGQAVERLKIEQAVAILTKAVPGLEAQSVSLPANAYDVLRVGGRGWYPLMFQSASLNPYNGDIAATRLISDRSKLEFVTESMRPLHTGDFGGLWVKLIWAFFGLVLTLMVLSGLLIWTKRTAIATATALKRAPRVTTHSTAAAAPSEVNP